MNDGIVDGPADGEVEGGDEASGHRSRAMREDMYKPKHTDKRQTVSFLRPRELIMPHNNPTPHHPITLASPRPVHIHAGLPFR